MGLTAKTDSGATLWDGPYGGFMNWRNTIALAAGYSVEWAPTAPAAPD